MRVGSELEKTLVRIGVQGLEVLVDTAPLACDMP
jgi:hypothetical protein